jgi:hypothetical protein
MGEIRALALPRVSREGITDALRQEIGLGWDEVAHVTATTTLARVIQEDGVAALPLATLLDLTILPGLPGEMSLPLAGFPDSEHLATSRATYRAKVRAWQQEASGRRLRTGIQVDDSLRRFVRDDAPDRVGRALLASRRQYATTIHTLVAAGVRPGELQAQNPVGQLAARAWAQAEGDVPALGAPRELLWVDLDDLAAGSTPEGIGLRGRINSALEKAFGNAACTVVHHGFYFYTPAQWAFFQAMARVPGLDQVFIVHDDGENPAFSTWRYFFRTEWEMPVPRLLSGSNDLSRAATAFRGALSGTGAGAPEDVEVVECRSPAELVRLWRKETDGDQPPPARFAAAAEQVERCVGRLGRQVTADESEHGASEPTLSQLPVGSFLLALHGCIDDHNGSVSFTLNGDALLDIVSSGYLDMADSSGRAGAPLLRRVLPYFTGCRSADDWTQRAHLLLETVQQSVVPFGARDPENDDATRIERAVLNPTRLVPWADISSGEAEWVRSTVVAVARLLEEITARERVVLGAYLDRIRQRLDRALRLLPPEEASAVKTKLRGLGVLTNEEIDVAGLVDVVAMILGRRIDGPGPDDDPERTKVKQLRGLDALGLVRVAGDLHLANMAEDAFPTGGQAVGWPFTLADLRASPTEAVEPITAGLLETRAQTAGLSDLYLFWLALDGVRPGGKVKISWVSDAAGERRRLSPIVALLTEPNSTEAVKKVAGGIQVTPGPNPAEREADRARPELDQPVEDDDVLAAALDSIHVRAAAVAHACPRRFALQWGIRADALLRPVAPAVHALRQCGRRAAGRRRLLEHREGGRR